VNFVNVVLERLICQASLTPAVVQAIAAVQQKVEDLSGIYSEAEKASYMDMSVDSIREGLGRDVSDLLQASPNNTVRVSECERCCLLLHANACLCCSR
jgi:hypothetical protein